MNTRQCEPREPHTVAVVDEVVTGLRAEIERLTKLNAELMKCDGDAEAVCNSYATENQQFSDQIEQLTRERDKATDALRIFIGCAYPVAKEINPRGHAWRGEPSLDYALSEALAALGFKQL